MKEELLQFLCDPHDSGPLRLEVETRYGDEIVTGRLLASGSARVYPIMHGVPRFVVSSNYSDSFGLQWNRFSKVQLDSDNGATYSRRRFERETLWSRADLEGKWVLDGGCGAGRFAEIAASLGANVIALDYSSAVDAAARNLASLPNVHCVQGDLLRLPLAPGSLSFMYSIGVLQHTPDPRAALASALGVLEHGGRFAFTIYARRWYTRLYSKYLLRPFTRRLPPERLLRAVERVMPMAFPMTDVLFRLPVVSRLFQFGIPVANYVDKTEFTRDQRYQEAVLDTFDMLAPAFDTPMTAGEVEAVLRAEGVQDYRFLHRVPIEVVGSVGIPSHSRGGT